MSAHNKKGTISLLNEEKNYVILSSSFFNMTTKATHYLLYVLFLSLCVFTAACSDEESFTTAADAKLSFSSDTVSFDTIFSGISSSTERFNVYNRNSKAVRLSNVKLESGGASGFRMNVDGQYGSSLSNIDILKNDSIFVFVEVTCKEQQTATPALVSDAIVFTLENGMQQKVVLEAYGQNIRMMKAVTIKNDTTISSSIPVVVYDSLVVAEGATLNIDAGTTLCFHNDANLLVHGNLNINGTLEKPVTLRGDRTDKMFPYLPYDRLDGQWGGVWISSTSKACSIKYADIHSGCFGIICDSIKEGIVIENSIIHNVAGDALRLTDCKALVANTQISNAFGNCVGIYGGSADFYYCTLAQFYPWDGDRESALYVSNSIGDETHLVEHANFLNCFVTGYADDEVFGNPGENELNIRFYNCVLMTDVSDEQYFIDCTAEAKDKDKYKETNFTLFDTDTYSYDFHLDSLSTAREMGAAEYSALYPLDKDGTPRGTSPDAGCYQWK